MRIILGTVITIFVILVYTYTTVIGFLEKVVSTQPASGSVVVAAESLQSIIQIKHVANGLDEANMYDAQQLPDVVRNYWNSFCPRGSACYSYWQSGNLQCVEFVSGVFALAGTPLPPETLTEDAVHFWTTYAQANIQKLGYREIPAGTGYPSPGDMVVWSHGAFGHIAVVTNVTTTSMTVAQANAPTSSYTMQFDAQLKPITWPPDAEGPYTVLGYIVPPVTDVHGAGAKQNAGQSPVTGGQDTTVRQTTCPATATTKDDFVACAEEAARQVGIPPTLFVKQINQESQFINQPPNKAGAEGIAQFLPGTAATLGIDPMNPKEALAGAASLMAKYYNDYLGANTDPAAPVEAYAKALAAYNAGPGSVSTAITLSNSPNSRCYHNWTVCLPSETQHYIETIMVN